VNGKEQLWNALLRIADETGASIRANDRGPEKAPIIIPHKEAGVTISLRSAPAGDCLRICFDGFVSRAGSGSIRSHSLLRMVEGCYRDASLAAELDRERILVTPQDLKDISDLLQEHPVNDNDKPYRYHSSRKPSPYAPPTSGSDDNLADLIGRIELVQTLTGADVYTKYGYIHFRYPEDSHIRIDFSPDINKDQTISMQFAGISRVYEKCLSAGELHQIAKEAETASLLLGIFERAPLKVTQEEYKRMVEHYAAASTPVEDQTAGFGEIRQGL